MPAKARSTHAAPTAKTNAAGKKGGGAEPVKLQIVKSDADAEPAQLATQSVAGLVTEQIAADPNGLAAPPAAQLGSEAILIGDEMAVENSAAIEREAFAGAIEPLPEQSMSWPPSLHP